MNILDIVQNSIVAEASLIEIALDEDTKNNTLSITITDNGKGMGKQQLENVQSPFFTSRTTRKVGLGVPLFKMASEMTGGTFTIDSQPDKGTRLNAEFNTAHIDFTPLGDIPGTISLLISCNPEIDFVYFHTKNGKNYTLDTRELREILEDVPLNNPEVASWVKDNLSESIQNL